MKITLLNLAIKDLGKVLLKLIVLKIYRFVYFVGIGIKFLFSYNLFKTRKRIYFFFASHKN